MNCYTTNDTATVIDFASRLLANAVISFSGVIFSVDYVHESTSVMPSSRTIISSLLPLADFVQDGLLTGCNGLNPSLAYLDSLTSG